MQRQHTTRRRWQCPLYPPLPMALQCLEAAPTTPPCGPCRCWSPRPLGNNNGPAFFAHFAKSVSHVAPPEDAAIVAVVVVAVVVIDVVAIVIVAVIVIAVVAVVAVAIADAVIEFPIVIVLVVLLCTAPSLKSSNPPALPSPLLSFPSRWHHPSP